MNESNVLDVREITKLRDKLGDWEATFSGRTPEQMISLLAKTQKERDEAVDKAERTLRACEIHEQGIIAQRDEALAACVTLRDFIEIGAGLECNCRFDGGHEPSCRIVKAHDLLSADCGKAFLERMNEAERLLSVDLKTLFMSTPDKLGWMGRRDAWLGGIK